MVELTGLPAGCGVPSATETAPICECLEPFKVNEIEGSLSDVRNTILDSFAGYVEDDSSVRGYIIWKSSRPVSKGAMDRGFPRIGEYLEKQHGIKKVRITIQYVLADVDLAEFWILPAGASPPIP